MNLELYNLTEEREKRLWESAIFIFDSSALLDFYFLPKSTRTKIFQDLFKDKLDGKLWIPAHVKFEYYKNREGIIKKPISENYAPLKIEILKKIEDSVNLVNNKTNDLKDRTRKDDKHPHLEQTEIDKYLENINEFKETTKKFKEGILSQLSEIEKEIIELPKDDDVKVAIDNCFVVGNDFSFEQIMEISKEGKHRYSLSIPPGYMDLKEKKGTQIFGDLIVWKQILEYAKEVNKPIIFICNDLKEDWCYLEKGTEKRIESPREELIKEIYDSSSTEFWMYNQAQFLYKANTLISKTVEDDEIERLSLFLTDRFHKKKRRSNVATFDEFYQCDECDGKDGYGNYVTSWDETGLINEYPLEHHLAKYEHAEVGYCEWCNTIHIKCPQCDSITAISQYSYNEKVECEGGCGLIYFIESDTSYDNMGYDEFEIKIIDHRIEECAACGEEYIDDGGNTSLCSKCNEEYGTEK
jgi:hypothetical protein